MHIVFVLLYSVCRSVCVLSCVDVIRCFTYVLRVILTSLNDVVRESATESNTNGLFVGSSGSLTVARFDQKTGKGMK